MRAEPAGVPAAEMVAENQLGVPNIMKVALCVGPPLSAAVTVAIEPMGLAAANQALGMVLEYLRVRLAPLGPTCCSVVMLIGGTPSKNALMLIDALKTLEEPNASYNWMRIASVFMLGCTCGVCTSNACDAAGRLACE